MSPSDRGTSTKKKLAVGLLGLWLALIPFLLMNFAVIWSGEAKSICVAGLLVIGNLATLYRDSKRSHEELVRDFGGASKWMIRLRLLGLASIVVSAKLVTSLNLHFASEDRNGVVNGLKTFDWFGEWELIALLIFGVIAVLTGTIGKQAETLSSKTIKVLGTVQFFTSFYLLLSGLWGREALRAATKIFSLSWSDPWPLSLDRQLAAVFLYERQGDLVFYTAFVALPLAWLSISMLRWIRVDSPRPTIAGRGFVMSTCLLILGASMYARTDTALGRHALIWMLGRSADARDKTFVSCLKTSAPSDSAEMQCAANWESGWTSELDQISQSIVKKLPQSHRPEFREQDQALRNTSLSALREPADRPGERFLYIMQRGSVVKDLAIKYRQYLQQLPGQR
jgi:hypothetical protein